ncbi:MAG: SLC13 family permease [Aureliella sp.]
MQSSSRSKKAIQWLGLFLGPALATACMIWLPADYIPAQPPEATSVAQTSSPKEAAATEAPDDSMANDLMTYERVGEAESPIETSEFSWEGRATLAVMVWMGLWWLTEAIEISATALLPLVLFPLLGAADIRAASAPYANYLIFLYFGGFILALSMERWGLGKRIALLTLSLIGTSASRMIAGFMVVTAVLSAFVSNTATTAMMLPIALSTIALVQGKTPEEDTDGRTTTQFGTCLLLGIAYAASVGGIMTIIGTPTNAFLIGFLERNIAAPYRYRFDFSSWLPIGLSLTVVFLPIIYLLLTKVLFPIRGIELQGGKELIRTELKRLGSVNRGEWITFLVFIGAVVGWLFRPLIARIEFAWQGEIYTPLSGISDTGIAMTAAISLFLIPTSIQEREFAMDWKTVNKMPWGILIMFGGGLSLATAIANNGVAEFLGSYAGRIGDLPIFLTVLLVTAAIVFMTELTSNVATTTSLVPVLAAVAPGIGIHPYLLIIPATVAASCAFMLPVATPPNAIVFGSGEIELPQMIRAGVVLNILALFVVTILTFVVIKPWMGI